MLKRCCKDSENFGNMQEKSAFLVEKGENDIEDTH